MTASKPPEWEVQGRTARQLWKKFYGAIPAKLLVPAASEPEPEDAEPQFGEWGEHWKGRRMTTEHAQIDDNGDHVGTGVFVDNRFTSVDGGTEGVDGWAAQRTRLGHPRGDRRPPPEPLPLPTEPAQ
jgi:hypothetical protein